MPYPPDPTTTFPKLKQEASRIFQMIDGADYNEVLYAVRQRQDSQRYVRQTRRAEIILVNVHLRIASDIGATVEKFYDTERWDKHDMKKVCMKLDTVFLYTYIICIHC